MEVGFLFSNWYALSCMASCLCRFFCKSGEQKTKSRHCIIMPRNLLDMLQLLHCEIVYKLFFEWMALCTIEESYNNYTSLKWHYILGKITFATAVWLCCKCNSRIHKWSFVAWNGFLEAKSFECQLQICTLIKTEIYTRKHKSCELLVYTYLFYTHRTPTGCQKSWVIVVNLSERLESLTREWSVIGIFTLIFL